MLRRAGRVEAKPRNPTTLTSSDQRLKESDCALFLYTDAFDLYTWGNGSTGMLGHGENAEENVPKVVEALQSKDVMKIACGTTHTVVLTSKSHCMNSEVPTKRSRALNVNTP